MLFPFNTAPQRGNLKSMRVLLRGVKSRLFFQEGEQWVADGAKARCFKGSREATLFAKGKAMKDVEVAFRSEDGLYDFAITC